MYGVAKSPVSNKWLFCGVDGVDGAAVFSSENGNLFYIKCVRTIVVGMRRVTK